MTNDQTVTQAIAAKLDIERKEREVRAEQWSFVRSQLGWVPEDQVSVERNELVLDDYQSSVGNHSYLEQVHLWEVQPGEGEDLRRALLMLPELLSYQARDAMTDDERVAVGWADIPPTEAITAWNTRTAHPGEGRSNGAKRSVIERAVADDLIAAIYKAEGWTPGDKAGFETRTARCSALYEITADARRNRYVATPLSTPRSNGAGEALSGLEWTEDGLSLRTPYDGDVDGDGRHIVVGGDLIVTFDDSEIADKYRARVLAALSAPQGEVERPDAEEDDRSRLGTSIDRIDAMEEAAQLRHALTDAISMLDHIVEQTGYASGSGSGDYRAQEELSDHREKWRTALAQPEAGGE